MDGNNIAIKNKSLNNTFNKKILSNIIDNSINSLLNSGVIFFALTLNIVDESLHNNFEKNSKDYLKYMIDTLKELENRFQLLSIIHMATELNKQSKRHIHIIIGIRSIIGYNESIKHNLQLSLDQCFRYDDIQFRLLNTFLDIKNYYMYITKDIKTMYTEHVLSSYDSNGQHALAQIADYINSESDNWFEGINFFSDPEADEKDVNYFLTMPKITKKHYTVLTILHFWNYYLHFNKIKYCNGNLYKKIEISEISYEKIDSVDFLWKNIDTIFKFFSENYWTQFFEFDFYSIKIEFLEKAKKYLENFDSYVFETNSIVLDLNILEFSDGIYMLKEDKFLNKLKKNSLNKCTSKFYNRTYHNLSKPKLWLKNIEQVVKSEDRQELYSYLGAIISDNIDLLKKKRTLYIYGESNTKKTTLVAKPLINFFGEENVGFVSGESSNFNFEHLKNKRLGVFDEFKYYPKNRESWLKFFEGSKELINLKNEKNSVLKAIPMVLISNNLVKEFESNKAFNNRLKTIKFEYTRIEQILIDEEIDKFIINEEPNIVVYCNKEFVRIKKKIRAQKEQITEVKVENPN